MKSSLKYLAASCGLPLAATLLCASCNPTPEAEPATMAAKPMVEAAQPPTSPSTAKSRDADLTSPPQLRDEGGAAKQVPLRFPAKMGASAHWRIQIRCFVPANGRQSGITCDAETQVTNVTKGHFTTQTTYAHPKVNGNFGDSLGQLRQVLLSSRPTRTYNTRGQLLAQREDTGGISYNFPVKPVSAGASWKGFEASKNGNIPLTLNLEKIIRHKGHNIAVLRCDYPLPSSNGSVKWFDVDAGDIILSWKYESDEIQGTTVETRTLSEKLS